MVSLSVDGRIYLRAHARNKSLDILLQANHPLADGLRPRMCDFSKRRVQFLGGWQVPINERLQRGNGRILRVDKANAF